VSRTVKGHDERYAEFLDVAQRLFISQGYDHTTVQDVIDAVGVAKGTFYHYFDSKQAVLEALVTAYADQLLAVFEDIVGDSSLDSVEKWTRWTQVSAQAKLARKSDALAYARAVLVDDNVLSHALEAHVAHVAVPALVEIVAQGVEEGTFRTAYVGETAELAYAIATRVQHLIADLVLHPEAYDDAEGKAQRLLAAGQAAFERVLGAEPGTLPWGAASSLSDWFTG